jgi:tRNA-splicing ligase RtcB
MKYISGERLIIKSWCDNPEESAVAQARNLANLPFLFKQVCLMPDTHCGYGMPIGAVIAAENVVIPNAVGVDIGCGMHAVRTNLNARALSFVKLQKIVALIQERVPVGFKHHSEPRIEALPWIAYKEPGYKIVREQGEKIAYQIGTLGGGNHFIEIQKDEEGLIWFMIHSGSRNLGKQVADYYNKLAVSLNAKWRSTVPKEWELAFLPMDSFEGQEYIKEMHYCLDFARASRSLMAAAVMETIQLGWGGTCIARHEIDIHHNYATLEHHFGHNVLVHRKGATRVREAEIGVIPGSQGTHSYIVEGLGNADSFMSCSHGAGRRMGRKEAVRSLDFDAEVAAMDAKGIIHGIRSQDDLEEAPGAYKPIDLVMSEQADLVKVLHKLEPLAVIKG